MRVEYPSWVCGDCGDRYGRRSSGVATWHPDTCGICGEEAIVTEPRDFGHLLDGWQAHKNKEDNGE